MKYKIYKIIFPNGKLYIGYTSRTLRKRFSEHMTRASKLGTPLYHAIRKYKEENIQIELIESYDNKEEALQAEIQFIKENKTTDINFGYNLHEGGGDPPNNGHLRKGISLYDIMSKEQIQESQRKRVATIKRRAKRMTPTERKKRWGHQRGKKMSKDTIEKRINTIKNMSKKERRMKYGTAIGKKWYHNPDNVFEKYYGVEGTQPKKYILGRGRMK